MIYLATPYSHPEDQIREARYEQAVRHTLTLVEFQIPVCSPIAFWHSISQSHNLPGDHEFWSAQDLASMQGCTELWVIQMDGWNRSKGVLNEIEEWRKLKGTASIFHIEPQDLEAQCELYLERREARRNQGVLDAMKTVSARAGTSSPTGEVPEPPENTTDAPDALAVFGPNL